VFFRPEEYRVRSIVSDDVRSAEARPVDGGQKQMRIGAGFLDAPFEMLVDGDVYRNAAMGARGGNLHFQAFISEAPLHEGRGEGILRSSPEDALPGAELEPMRCAVTGHGESPTYIPVRVADQEEKALLQVVQDVCDQGGRQFQRIRNLAGSQGEAAIARQLAHYEIADGMVSGDHGLQCTMVHW